LVGRAGFEPATNGLKEENCKKNLYKSAVFYRCVVYSYFMALLDNIYQQI